MNSYLPKTVLSDVMALYMSPTEVMKKSFTEALLEGLLLRAFALCHDGVLEKFSAKIFNSEPEALEKTKLRGQTADGTPDVRFQESFGDAPS